MRKHTRCTPIAALAVLASLAIPSGVAADRRSGEICWSPRAHMEGSFTTEECASLYGLCTTGVVTSRAGWLIGEFDFMVLAGGGGLLGEPSIVTPPIEPATTWSYVGEMTIATWLGDLHISDIGVFDTAGGTFSEVARVTGGTGLYAGVTGNLFIHGTSYPDGTGFSSDLSGRLCLPLRRPHQGDDD